MKRFWNAVLDILFPQSMDEQILSEETTASFSKKFKVETVVPKVVSLSSFKEPAVRAAVHLVKFHNHPHAAKLLATLVHAYVHIYVQRETVLIPVPLSAKRLKERGHNQVLTILRANNDTHPLVRICTDLLIKTKHTAPQSSLSRTQRKTNVSGVFALTNKAGETLAGKHVIIIDDVVTTGSTLLHARKAVQEAHPASVVCVAIAH